MERKLLDELRKYGASDHYPLHMPGHKRNIRSFMDPFSIDITEIHGFDNLFHAEDLLLEMQQKASGLYGSDETFYLVNGSTCGILAAVSASVKRGSHILMARNCHKAAYHAVLLNGLKVTYLYPSVDPERGMNGTIRAEDVEQALKHAEHPVQAVLITSPTYDGVVSDIKEIAEMVHKAGAVLIVDEAHGAHFAMNSYFPETALALGADLVINSLHKTMPSLTQTALLHVKGPRVDRQILKKYLGIYQTSSPSYVLMASMDACVDLMQEQKEVLFGTFIKKLEKLRTSLSGMQVLHLVDGTEPGLNAYAFDGSKVIISTEKSRINGPELGKILREVYHMEPEMEAEQYVTAIMTVADTQEGFERLEHALLEIDRELCEEKFVLIDSISADIRQENSDNKAEPNVLRKQEKDKFLLLKNEGVLTLEEAEYLQKEQILLSESAGRISGEFVYLYPPGIPILVPGERISQKMPEQIAYYRSIGLSVQGLQDYDGAYIMVTDKSLENSSAVNK